MSYQVIWEKNQGSLQGELPTVVQGGTLETITILALYRDGTSIDLSTMTLSATATDRDENTTTITGTFTGANGLFTWEFSAGDVGTSGNYEVVVTYTDGVDSWNSDPVKFTVRPHPAATALQNPALVGISPAKDAWLTAGLAAVPAGGDIATKDTDAVTGNAAEFDANGNTVDAGFAFGTAAAANTGDFDAAGAAGAAISAAIATQAEVDAGTSLTDLVTPGTLSSYRKLLRVLRFGQAVFPWAGVWDGVGWYGGGVKTDTTNNSQNSKMRFNTKFACSDLRLMYANSYDNEVATPNDITIRVGLETATATYPVFFDGQRSVTIGGGGFVISDPIAIDLAAGSYIWTRTYLTVANATDDWPQQRFRLFDAGERTERGLGLADMSLTGTIGTGTVTGYGPMAIGATIPNGAAQVILMGDSIMFGQGDVTDGSQYGFGSRALNGINPYLKVARAGEQASQFAGTGKLIRGSVALSADYAICNYGINDLVASASVATLQASLVSVWTALANSGVRVYQCTITPKTSSTDAWATTANQTPNLPNESFRTNINDWIRTTPAPLAGYFETADAVESARNSGLWKAPGYTADGLHPSSAGHIAMAAAITPALFI